MTAFVFIVGALATYRLTMLVSRDLGPGDICKRLRKLSPKWLGCPYCFSVTAGALIEASLWFSGFRDPLAVVICLVLAFSGVAICLDRTFSSDHQPK